MSPFLALTADGVRRQITKVIRRKPGDAGSCKAVCNQECDSHWSSIVSDLCFCLPCPEYGSMETFLTLSTRLVTLSVQETTAMTRQSLSSSGTGLVTVTDVQTQEERPQKIISVAKSYRQFQFVEMPLILTVVNTDQGFHLVRIHTTQGSHKP